MSAAAPDLFSIIGISDFLQPATAARKPVRSANKPDQTIFLEDIEKQIRLVKEYSAKYSTMVDGTATLADGTIQQVPKDFPATSGRGQRITWFRIDKDGRWVLNLFIGNLLVFDNPFLIVGGWTGLSKVLAEIKLAGENGKFNARFVFVRQESKVRREDNKKKRPAKAATTAPAEAKAA